VPVLMECSGLSGWMVNCFVQALESEKGLATAGPRGSFSYLRCRNPDSCGGVRCGCSTSVSCEVIRRFSKKSGEWREVAPKPSAASPSCGSGEVVGYGTMGAVSGNAYP
jgi:hypothetical protein